MKITGPGCAAAACFVEGCPEGAALDEALSPV